MADSIKDMLSQLTSDPWRSQVGFTQDLEAAQNALFDPANNPEDILSDWLSAYQPCFFGRAAAKYGLLRYCILRESDCVTDEAVRGKIQNDRTLWSRDALDGKASGFIILLISPQISNATPDEVMAKIAHRLCSLYLRDTNVKMSQVHQERVYLEKPGPDRIAWEWLAGVNYFCAQGDKRWWHDHRIPGGMGFSVNSVGHMAQAGRFAEAINNLNKEIGLPDDEYGGGKIKSLEDALKVAMLTIDNATEAISGRATQLLDVSDDEEIAPLPKCPINLPPKLAGKNHCDYFGWYDTDQTLPSEYFRADVERPSDVAGHTLDFTYLFQRDVNNPAHETMGLGRRIRADGQGESEEAVESKLQRMKPKEVPLETLNWRK